MPRILVVGSANVDFTIAAPRLPAPGETVSGGVLFVAHGGKGANQAVAAPTAGHRCPADRVHRRRGRGTRHPPRTFPAACSLECAID